jgi:hypothetical protein
MRARAAGYGRAAAGPAPTARREAPVSACRREARQADTMRPRPRSDLPRPAAGSACRRTPTPRSRYSPLVSHASCYYQHVLFLATTNKLSRGRPDSRLTRDAEHWLVTEQSIRAEDYSWVQVAGGGHRWRMVSNEGCTRSTKEEQTLHDPSLILDSSRWLWGGH